MSGLVVKNSNELWFNNNKLSTSTGTKGLYIDTNRNLFFNDVKIASGNLSNPKGLHLVNNELAFDGIKFVTGLNVLIGSLFANNEQGFAFDFNDLSTMYQDSAGTIPVTSVGQPVGLVLDKSKPVLVNRQSILDSSFLTVKDWVLNNTEISVSETNGALRISKGAITPTGIYKAFSCEANVLYRLTVKYKNHSGNNVRFFVLTGVGFGIATVLAQALQTSTTVEGEFSTFFISSSNTHSIFIDSQNAAASSIDITQVSIVKISDSANHAYQSVSAKRPILQQNATTGAYYLLFDGVDDFLTTGSFPTMGMGTTVFTGTLCTKSTTSVIISKTSSGYLYQTSSQISVQNPTPAPLAVSGSVVATVLWSADDNSMILRANNLTSTVAVSNRGLYNGNPLLIGVFSATGVNPFQGNMYSLIGINRVATTPEIISVENAIAKNVGVTL